MTLRFCLIPGSTSWSRNQVIASAGEAAGKRRLRPCGWESKLFQPVLKSVLGVLRKLKLEIAFDPAVPLLHCLPLIVLSPAAGTCGTHKLLLRNPENTVSDIEGDDTGACRDVFFDVKFHPQILMTLLFSELVTLSFGDGPQPCWPQMSISVSSDPWVWNLFNVLVLL